jgi:hypothetical protein
VTVREHLLTWWRERHRRCPRCGDPSPDRYWDARCKACNDTALAPLRQWYREVLRDVAVREARDRNRRIPERPA